MCWWIPVNLIWAQPTTGVWKGELKQHPQKVFYFEIHVEEVKENGEFTGTTYIESYGESLSQKGDYGTIRFTGNWQGNQVNIQETAIIKELKKSSLYGWCIKKLSLTYREENDEMILEGPWNAPNGCPPGTLMVKRALNKPIHNLDTLENRVIETKYQAEVKKNELTLTLWDHNLIDGDRVSLNLNGEWILESYTLQKEKKAINLTLTQKENILIMHAINLGTSPPNTATIVINDGQTEQTFILNSNEGKSEAITIRLK